MRFCLRPLILALLVLAFFAPSAPAQNRPAPAAAPAQSRGSISGSVTDPSGALIPGATVTLVNLANQQKRTAISNDGGSYSFSNVPAGRYTLAVDFPGFNPYQGKPIAVSNAPYAADIQLGLASAQIQYEVSADTPTVDPDTNASSTTMSEETLNALPDNPDDMLAQLQAIAGGTGAKITVDGFDASRMPPKSSILQVRINADPYSAENDTSPQSGTIQIITKPGVENIHGGFNFSGISSALNAPNPVVHNQPPYNSEQLYANLNGPVTKNSSYDGFLYRNTSHTNALIDARTIDSSNNQIEFFDATPNPNTNMFGNVRYKFQPTPAIITTIGYNFQHNAQNNASVGQTSLRSYGVDNSGWSHTLQLSNTWLFGKNVANVTRFQFTRNTFEQSPVSTDPALVVSGSFASGGNPGGHNTNAREHYELQNYVMDTVGKHYLEFGVRLRTDFTTTTATTNFNGSWVFSAPGCNPNCAGHAGQTLTSLDSYQITLNGIAAKQTAAQIRAAGGGPSQFTIATGKATNSASMTDGGFFVQDDWKARTNLTVSFGVRFETQTGITDHAKDWSPRLGFSWAVDKKHNWTLRAGAGFFYSRFAADTILNVRRQNGNNVQTYTATSPDYNPYYPAIPPTSALAASGSAAVIYQIAPSYRAPYQFIYEGEIDRSLGKHGSLALTARHIDGVHSQYLRNANAPLPGTYNSAVSNSGTCPFGCGYALNQYTSGGNFNIDTITLNSNLNFGAFGGIFGNYRYRTFNSDSNGGFPTNQYNLHADYGRANGDSHHIFYMGYNTPLVKHFRFSGFVNGTSGSPFNITVTQDLNGDLQLNDRPAFATDLTRPSVVATRWGTFDTKPIAGQTIIPINYAQGSIVFNTVASLSRTFNFYKEPPKRDPKSKEPPPKGPVHPYSLSLGGVAADPLNHPNYGNPSGVLGSPNFGRVLNTAATARGIRFGTNFNF